MKLLLLNKEPVVGATWVGPYHLVSIITPNGDCFSADGWEFYEEISAFPLLSFFDEQIFVNSECKIRFEKPYQNLKIPKGLNEF